MNPIRWSNVGSMSRNFSNHAVCAIAISFAWAAGLWADELRTWTDSGGKHKVKARFVSLADETVTLEREDGERVEIELKRLSAADRKYIAERSEDPFKPAKTPSTERKTKFKAKGDMAEHDAAMLKPDWSDARLIDLAPREDAWKFSAERPVKASRARPRPISLPSNVDFFEKLVGMVVNESGSRAALGYKLKRPGSNDHSSRVVLVDLERGKILGSGSIQGEFAPMDLDKDGKRLLVRRDAFGHGNQDWLELWRLESTGIEVESRWMPYDAEQRGDRDIVWAGFAANDRIVTSSGGGKIAVWNAETKSPEHWLQAKAGCAPGLSPDRKTLALATDKEIALLDIEKREVICTAAAPAMAWPHLFFDQTGTRLACLAHTRLLVWDLSNGQLYREIELTGMHANNCLAWSGIKHVVVGNRYLIDIENQVPLWDYQNAEAARAAGEYVWFEFSEANRRPGGLTPAKLPTPELERALASAMQDPRFFVMRPGSTIRINVDGIQDVGQREKIRSALANKLASNNIKVADAADLELIASTEVGAERDITYHMFGEIGTRTYKVRPGIARVRFVYGGKDAWRTEATNLPFFVRLKQGETMEQHLRGCEKPNLKFFESVTLPKLLIRPTGKTTLGSSRIGLASTR